MFKCFKLVNDFICNLSLPMLKKSTFLKQFWVQAVQLEKKIRKGAYAHFENKWGLQSKKIHFY